MLATNINQQTTVRLQQLSKNKPPFDCNNNQNSHTLFRLKLNFKQYRPGMQQYKSKSNFINPALTTINSAIINPPLLLQIFYLSISGICVLTVICAICDIRSRSGFGTNTPKSPALVHKQALIKNYCLYDQTTQNYST